MATFKSSTFINGEQPAHDKLRAFSRISLTDKTPRSDCLELIDPNLLAGAEYSQESWAPLQMSHLQQSTAEPLLSEHMTQAMLGRAVHDMVPYPLLGYGRHQSPFSIHNSPGYSFAQSPSIRSEEYCEALNGPATPPDSLLLPMPYETYDIGNTGCPQDSTYAEATDINSCQTSQGNDLTMDHTYFGGSIGIPGSYPYGAAMISPPLLPTEDGFDCQVFSALAPSSCHGHSHSHSSSSNGTRSSTVDTVDDTGRYEFPPCEQTGSEHEATSVESSPPTRGTPRRGRIPRNSTATTTACKRASPDHTGSPHGDKRRKLPSNCHRQCLKCKRQFPDRKSLESHMQAEHPRPFVCVFHYAGCTSRFDAKNEWKRHVSTKHLGLRYWLCTEGNCAQARGPSTHRRGPSLPELGSIFNRKDLYTQHVRRMHSDAAGQSTTDYKKSTPESDSRLKRMQDAAVRVRCSLPTHMPCPVKHCGKEFSGLAAWDDRMEHVAQQHFENAAAGREPPVEFGGPDDAALTSWAQRDDVRIVRQTETGWELCDPLKGNGGSRRPSSGMEVGEEDAEGEEQG